MVRERKYYIVFAKKECEEDEEEKEQAGALR